MKHGIGEIDNTSIILCFFGTMGHQLDMETVIEAAKRLLEIPVKIVLCGDGDSLERYRKMADGCSNLIFPGWVGAGEIRTLMSLASAGLAPYRSSPSFIRSIPNKAIEYLSAGLPIVTSLDGKLRTLIDECKCGYWYRNGDVDGLVSIVLRMYKNREELKALSVNSTRVYNERFNARKIYGQLADYLEIVANEGRRYSKRG
ncbi:hypothetical protein hamaS1_07410 [Moorella sp. Hama-1]|nr:hypothetical protein hamaS1_07410 [Moorella sp. Hama-1]